MRRLVFATPGRNCIVRPTEPDGGRDRRPFAGAGGIFAGEGAESFAGFVNFHRHSGACEARAMMCNCDVQLTDGQVRSAPKTARRANHFKNLSSDCPVVAKKIFRLTRRANQLYKFARLTRQEGRLAIVTKRAVGCGGRGSVGAQGDRRAGFRERCTARRRTAPKPGEASWRSRVDAYGKTVWFRHPLLVSSCRWRRRFNRIVSA
jgi:hypothetical protein